MALPRLIPARHRQRSVRSWMARLALIWRLTWEIDLFPDDIFDLDQNFRIIAKNKFLIIKSGDFI